MIETKALTLPGGDTLPLFLETVTVRPYTLCSVPVDEDHAGEILLGAAQQFVQSHMVAGTILRTEQRLQKNNGAYELHAAICCQEMISVCIPAEPLREDDTNGESDQR